MKAIRTGGIRFVVVSADPDPSEVNGSPVLGLADVELPPI